MLTTHNIDIQAMLVWLTLPFYDFCGFRSVAINSVYKLQFFTFIRCKPRLITHPTHSAMSALQVFILKGSIAATARCGLLLQMVCHGLCVCLSVGHVCES